MSGSATDFVPGQNRGVEGRRGAEQLVVAGILVDALDRATRVLAARRTRPPALAGRWELPGGKVEPGEAPEAALLRELDEELSVTVRLGAELAPTQGCAWPLAPGLAMRTWWCVVTGGFPRPGEAHDALRWVAMADLLDLDWLEPDRPVLAAVLASRRG